MKPVRTVVVRRLLPASRERVFAAWTRPEALVSWFAPQVGWQVEVEADVRVGGRFRFALRDPAGAVKIHEGTYRVLDPVARLAFSWTSVELGVTDSHVEVELTERGAQTELVLSHTLPDDDEIVGPHQRGWTGCLGLLASHLEEIR